MSTARDQKRGQSLGSGVSSRFRSRFFYLQQQQQLRYLIFDDTMRAQLLNMRVATIERTLKADKSALRRRLNTGT